MSNCTVHKLIEQFDANNLTAHEVIYRHANTCFDAIEQKLPRAMCFDMGHQTQWSGFKYVTELIKLPYPTCWFETEIDWADNGPGRVGFFCTNKGEEISVSIFHWDKVVGVWALSDFGALSFEKMPEAVVSKFASSTEAARKASHQQVGLLCTYLNYVNCCNVTRTDHKPDAALQRARAQRGKKPLFSFWTLDIDPQRSQSEGTGWTGEHASPRSHLRRGHARRLPSGHWCWVRACFVQGQTPGFVHKDYAVSH